MTETEINKDCHDKTSPSKYNHHRLGEIRWQEMFRALINNRMEKDRQLLTISVLTIGAEISFLNIVIEKGTSPASNWLIVFFGISVICLLTCSASVLRAFDASNDYLEACLKDKLEDSIAPNTKAMSLDKQAKNFLISGYVFALFAIVPYWYMKIN